MAQWIALTTYDKDKTVMVNLDQVAMMQGLGNKTALHFDADFHWTVSETLDKINTLPHETVQAQRLPGSDLYMKGILTLIALALLANVIIYMSHLPATQFYMSYSSPTHSPSWFSVLHTTDGKTGSW